MQAGAWTEQDTKTLRELLAREMRVADIARHMRTNYYRVKDKIRTLKDAQKLDARNEQRVRDVANGYVRRAGPEVERIERTCLCCGDKFIAEGRYLRLCPDDRRASW